MTRKHFQAIAKVLADYRRSIQNGHTYPEQQQFDLMIDDLMGVFRETNPNFDRGRFVRATHEQ